MEAMINGKYLDAFSIVS